MASISQYHNILSWVPWNSVVWQVEIWEGFKDPSANCSHPREIRNDITNLSMARKTSTDKFVALGSSLWEDIIVLPTLFTYILASEQPNYRRNKKWLMRLYLESWLSTTVLSFFEDLIICLPALAWRSRAWARERPHVYLSSRRTESVTGQQSA